jgi:NADH-quinone oxidoreductase subunit E
MGQNPTQRCLELDAVDRILQSRGRDQANLIPILQAVQGELGYLPEEAIRSIAHHLRLPPSRVFGVITFYAQFRLTPRGRHTVRVCRGTACHVRGGAAVVKAVQNVTGIQPGETSDDMRFTFETVACIGACALAPTVVADENTYGEMTPENAKELLDSLD